MAVAAGGRHDEGVLLLVPGDPLRPRRPDEHFASEAAAGCGLGMSVVVVDHHALTRPGGAQEAVVRVSVQGEAVYRGWMLRSEQYATFDEALSRRDVLLRTTPAQYRQAHELPGWYEPLAAVTPPSVWTTGTERAAYPANVDDSAVHRVVQRAVTPAMLGRQRQPDQAGDRPVGTQHRVRKLEQRVRPAPQRPVQLPPKLRQLPERSTPTGIVHTEHRSPCL